MIGQVGRAEGYATLAFPQAKGGFTHTKPHRPLFQWVGYESMEMVSKNQKIIAALGAEAACRTPEALLEGDEGCPLRDVLDRIGAKGSVLVVVLLKDGKLRFSDLRRSIPGVFPRDDPLDHHIASVDSDNSGVVHRSSPGNISRPRGTQVALCVRGRIREDGSTTSGSESCQGIDFMGKCHKFFLWIWGRRWPHTTPKYDL